MSIRSMYKMMFVGKTEHIKLAFLVEKTQKKKKKDSKIAKKKQFLCQFLKKKLIKMMIFQ